MYRTKELDKFKALLKPILDLIGVYISDDGYLVYIGSDRDNDESYVINNVSDKKLMLVSNMLQLYKYKEVKDTCEYFNPLVKYKNMLYLLLMTIPTMYNRYCKCVDIDDEDTLIAGILDDDCGMTQEDIARHVEILQYPKNPKTDESKIECRLTDTNGNRISFGYESDNKTINVFIVLLNIVEYLDKRPKILKTLGLNDNDDIYEYMTTLLNAYTRERELNRKDLAKLNIDNEADDIVLDINDTLTVEEPEIITKDDPVATEVNLLDIVSKMFNVNENISFDM